MLKFICYPKCTTCQKAQKWLDNHNLEYELRDIKVDTPTFEELSVWTAKSGISTKKFFNTSGIIYRDLNLKDNLGKMQNEEMLRLLSSNGMLVKRPLLVGEDFVLVGFKESEWESKICK